MTYGMFQKMFLQQSSQLPADVAVFFPLPQIGDNVSSLSFSESFVIIHGYINLTFVHTIALCSICYSKKIADGEIIFFFMIEWPPSSGVFCLNIYNQIATEETQAVIWERTEFKHQICHLLDIWPWNKLYYLYFQIITSTS